MTKPQRKKVDSWTEETLRYLLANLPDEHRISKISNASHRMPFLNSLVIAPTLKEENFSGEREWRLVAFGPVDDRQVELQTAKNMLVPYLSIDLKVTSEQSPLWQIIVGSTPHMRLAMSPLSYYFSRVKIANGITHSRIPYRDW